MIQAVYMHTSASPDPKNPNPAPGTIIVQLMDNFNRSFSGFNSIVSPVSGTPIVPTGSNLTLGTPYILVSVGALTAADALLLGIPAGLKPAVGLSFIAKATGVASGGSSAVEIAASAGSGVASIETLGDPNLSIAPNALLNQGFGAQFILQCRDYAGALVAPADGSVISLALYLSDSSITVQGE